MRMGSSSPSSRWRTSLKMKPDILEFPIALGRFEIILNDGGFKHPDGYTLINVALVGNTVNLRYRIKHPEG